MKSFIFLVFFGSLGFGAQVYAYQVYCMLENYQYCLECPVTEACRTTYDIEQIIADGRQVISRRTIANNVCDDSQETQDILRSPACGN